jgi:hypothetical protein
MGNNGSSIAEGNVFSCFTDDGQDSMITDSSISEINSEFMIQNVIWEFQRHQQTTGWGAGGNLLATDPGRYATHKRDRFSETLQGVAPPIQDGYRVDLGWAIVVHKRKYKQNSTPEATAKLSITDSFGWHYASSFDAKAWSDEHTTGLNVRRRAWRRTLIPIDSPNINPT